ncbi:Nonsense-mediated mRNA decay protein 5 [Mucor velutinosus]|uniref:Nonsense-mediated mRNA decay protein 5 n=1 Tax=Mucor velutinosus TaxID=708070 RepID=A0AAN7DCI5_9FUNG|nr:Nonsense-mediated mRNA decay protein 5 [Mucor velutinosus]
MIITLCFFKLTFLSSKFQPTPTVTSNFRLTLTKQTTAGNRSSKLPVASKKRRFSTIKATAVPLRRSPRTHAPTVEPLVSMITDSQLTTMPVVSSTDSTSILGLEPSAIAPSTPTTVCTGLHVPRPDEIHGHPQLPNWIQEIYARLSAHDSQLEQIKDLLKRNHELQLALDNANREIAQLKSTANHSLPPLPSAPTVPEKRSDGTSASKWADVAATPPLNDPPKKPQTLKTPKPKAITSSKPVPKGKSKRPPTLEQINRFYSAPSESHGYQFLYFTSRGREAISKIRAGFGVLGLSQSRILDIHYPENNTISFLVHNDYVDTVKDAMAKLPSSKLLNDFDPCAPSLLRDRKYTTNPDQAFVQAEATRIHQERLIRIVKRLHVPHVQLAVAREFCFKRQWLPESVYHSLYSAIYPDKSSKAIALSAQADVNMDDVPATQDSTTQPATSSTSISPADGVSAPLA